MGVSCSLVHLRTGRAPGAPFLPSACSAFVPCRSGHAGNHLDFTQVAFCVRRLPEVAYIAVIPPALPQVHLLPWTLPRHRSFSSLPVVRLVFASLGCRTRAYLCDHQQATRPHESAACGAALGSVVDCVGSGTPLGSLISGGAPTLLCCCLWCSSCPLHPLRPQVPSTHRGGIALIAGSHYIVMAEYNNPRRSRSRSRSARRVGSCDYCPACAVNRGILLRILHTVQDFQRATSTTPASTASGRPALDLSEVFTGTIDQASIQMAHPRTAALAVRHLESRCDSIVRMLDSIDDQLKRRGD